MKSKDEPKDTRSNFSPLLCFSEHRIENCLGGCCNPQFGELGLKYYYLKRYLGLKHPQNTAVNIIFKDQRTKIKQINKQNRHTYRWRLCILTIDIVNFRFSFLHKNAVLKPLKLIINLYIKTLSVLKWLPALNRAHYYTLLNYFSNIFKKRSGRTITPPYGTERRISPINFLGYHAVGTREQYRV